MTAEPQKEIIVGGLTKTKMILSIFSGLGKQLVKEVTPLKQIPRELELGAYDVTFDGQDEVVVLTPQAGL